MDANRFFVYGCERTLDEERTTSGARRVMCSGDVWVKKMSARGMKGGEGRRGREEGKGD